MAKTVQPSELCHGQLNYVPKLITRRFVQPDIFYTFIIQNAIARNLIVRSCDVAIHGGPTGMVVANMAVHSPFFQPANVEGTGSHHSWL